MEQMLLIAHVLLALAIIGLILIQQGKGADVGASFGGGASQTLLGSTGSGNALTRVTAILSTLFFVSSFTLAILAHRDAGGVEGLEGIPLPAAEEQRDQPRRAVDDIPEVEDNSAPAGSDIPSAPAGNEIPQGQQQ